MANQNTTGEADVEFTPDTDTGTDGQFIGATAQDNGGAEQSRGVRQLIKDSATNYGGQAGDKLRAFADDGKTRATDALGELAKTIEGAAETIEEKLGGQFGGYARSASTAVSDFSQRIGDKDIDDLLDDAREFVKRSPGIAIGAAAALGFVLARVLRSGVDANRDA